MFSPTHHVTCLPPPSPTLKAELPSHWDIKEFQSHMRNKGDKNGDKWKWNSGTSLTTAHWYCESQTLRPGAAGGLDAKDGEHYFTDTNAWMRWAVVHDLYDEPKPPSPSPLPPKPMFDSYGDGHELDGMDLDKAFQVGY